MYEGINDWIYFGDGFMCQVVDYKEFFDKEDGLEYLEFSLVPGTELAFKYNINDFNEEGFIKRIFSKTVVSHDASSSSRNRWSVDLNIEGGATPRSRRLSKFTEVIDDLQRRLELEKNSRYVLLQELEDERLNKMSTMKQQSDLLKIVASARGRTDETEGFSDEQ